MTIQINGTSGISGVDGSAATPALQGSDTNTGISFGTDEVNINTGGTTRATVDSNGRVLVGTSTSRGSAFEVEGTTYPTGRISVTNNSSTDSNQGAILNLNRTRSDDVGNTDAVSSGDRLGLVIFNGADGSSLASAAYVQAFVDGTPSTGQVPGRLEFATTASGASSPTERMRIQADGFVRINASSIIGTTNRLQVTDAIGVSAPNSASFRTTDGEACFYVGSMSTGRSINARGTVNASGSDYAEYMIKDGNFIIAKGDICGVTANGKLTNTFVDAISFVVKTTNPSIVGGDNWVDEDLLGKQPSKNDAAAYEEWNEKYEKVRETVDRIAFAGQVPVNVTGATPGQYIVPVEDNGGISGIAKDKSDLTLDEYMRSIGKVIAIEDDGRARIIVKVA